MVPLAALVVLATTAGAKRDRRAGRPGRWPAIAFAFLAYLVIALRRGGPVAGRGVRGDDRHAARVPLVQRASGARVSMGGVGSLAIGAALATVALLSGDVLLLPVIGALLVAEILSVIIQVGYFKWSGGKRIFRRAPAPPPFRDAGISEVNIVFPFLAGPRRSARLYGLVLAGSYEAGRQARHAPRARPNTRRAGPLPRRRGR
jgi:hypothetical protein